MEKGREVEWVGVKAVVSRDRASLRVLGVGYRVSTKLWGNLLKKWSRMTPVKVVAQTRWRHAS